ncbi:NAC domain-containing protein 83 [Medicago truncatula]|uniref:NAC domain-containing protein 83 n=1 Tax=Medicago truncatula TaxID=3880 RepID=UPI000D2F33C3|nr:NAC domain-containing protein 83 [Medicago truncatula]
MAVANVEPDLPAGFRFDPTDRQLVECYLTKKILNQPLPTHLFEFDVFQTEPWRLPRENRYSLEHRKYYFFDLRNRRFQNMDATPAGNGEWRMVEWNEEFALSNNQLIVRKNTYVYWRVQGSQAVMTQWWMHEFVISTIFHPIRVSPIAAYRIFKI